jgi:hypothetical protein
MLSHMSRLEQIYLYKSTGPGVNDLGEFSNFHEAHSRTALLQVLKSACPRLKYASLLDGSIWSIRRGSWEKDPNSPRITSDGPQVTSYPKSGDPMKKMFERDLENSVGLDLSSLLDTVDK